MGLMLIGIGWLALAVAVAMLIGRAVRVADLRQSTGISDRLPLLAFESGARLRVRQIVPGRQP
jgi:class 3 adenylate cyclase